jgi:hypothetical protein
MPVFEIHEIWGRGCYFVMSCAPILAYTEPEKYGGVSGCSVFKYAKGITSH